ncbi:esterase/lipase family protein [Streptomyces sp. NPDC086787]|uniref:esterase/lipase family protein n=1 Tax=Streptomyces sp. NPDC086787 TaxID=3365759 RepID=UPI0038002ECA
MVAAVALTLLASGQLTFRTTASAAPARSAPAEWGDRCGSGRLGLDKDTVQLAPTLRKEKKPDGSPVAYSPDTRGTYTPIVMVHGWTGSDTHDDAGQGAFSHRIDLTANRLGKVSTTRSLIGQFQSLPGAAVFTFDYHPYSARWVDDPHLGPALGKVIDCLYRASGQKVIVVGHSMGGLITRYAATHPGVSGSDRAAEISTVVTFGTPQTGSVAALLSEVGLDAGAVTNEELAVVRTILAACGRLTDGDIATGTLCDGLPAPVRAFESHAGRALRAGSAELRALKPWPKSIVVDALGGQTRFQVPDMGWFALPWSTKSVDSGDLIVTAGSALQGADSTRLLSCSYQLNAVRGATDSVALAFGQASKADVADVPLKALSGPCFHPDLMRSIELTNEALGVVSDDIESRRPVTAAGLLSAPVPAACGHRAGKLVDGRLPGIPEAHGVMGLSWVETDRPRSDLLTFGDLDGDGTGDAAATLFCNAGGVSWPEIIAFYSHGPELIGSVSLSAINLPGRGPGENASVHHLRYVDGGVVTQWSTQQDGDPGASATLDYTATLRWDGHAVVASGLTATTERGTVDRFLGALRKHDTAAASALAAPGVGAEAANQFRFHPDALAGTPTCYGPNSDFPPNAGGLGTVGGPEFVDAERYCLLPTSAAGGEYVVLGMSKTGFQRWRVSSFNVV